MKVALTPACRPGGGGGHVVRCLALAHALEAEGAVCAFVLSSPGAELLARLGWTGDVHGADAQAVRVQAIRGVGADAVVVDDYSLDADFETALGCPILAIDDLADRPHACVLLLDSAYGRVEADYVSLAPGARFLLGPTYALLRDGFAASGRTQPERVGRVFVCFGLSDVKGVTARAVRVLRPLLPEAVFEVALAHDATSVAALRAMAADDAGLVLHLDAEVAPLMRAADLGVGAGGGMVWERRASSLPQLVVTVADNQRAMAARLAADGVIACIDLCNPDFDLRLAQTFTNLLAPSVRQAQVDNPHARCDGQGARRAAQALLDMG